MKRILHRTILRGEALWDSRRKRNREINSPYIDPFIGYSTPQGIHLRGRVLDGKPLVEPVEPGTKWENIRQMTRRFVTSELPGVTVEIGDLTTATTDEEGYFSVDLPLRGAAITEIVASLPDHGVSVALPVMITPDSAVRGIISDIDDTVIRTDAFSLARNLWNTLTGDVASRVVFDDSKALLEWLHDGINPVFYVSSSPWNLHSYLVELFRRNGVIAGPLFLRDFGIDENKFIKSSHGEHKLAMIDTILAANPALRFVLMGDTGQHDPEVYYRAIGKHPGRFTHALFRIPGQGLDEFDSDYIGKIHDLGVAVFAGRDFGPADKIFA